MAAWATIQEILTPSPPGSSSRRSNDSKQLDEHVAHETVIPSLHSKYASIISQLSPANCCVGDEKWDAAVSVLRNLSHECCTQLWTLPSYQKEIKQLLFRMNRSLLECLQKEGFKNTDECYNLARETISYMHELHKYDDFAVVATADLARRCGDLWAHKHILGLYLPQMSPLFKREVMHALKSAEEMTMNNIRPVVPMLSKRKFVEVVDEEGDVDKEQISAQWLQQSSLDRMDSKLFLKRLVETICTDHPANFPLQQWKEELEDIQQLPDGSSACADFCSGESGQAVKRSHSMSIDQFNERDASNDQFEETEIAICSDKESSTTELSQNMLESATGNLQEKHSRRSARIFKNGGIDAVLLQSSNQGHQDVNMSRLLLAKEILEDVYCSQKMPECENELLFDYVVPASFIESIESCHDKNEATTFEVTAIDSSDSSAALQKALVPVHKTLIAVLLNNTISNSLQFYSRFIQAIADWVQNINLTSASLTALFLSEVEDLDVAVIISWDHILRLGDTSPFELLSSAAVAEQLLLAESALSILKYFDKEGDDDIDPPASCTKHRMVKVSRTILCGWQLLQSMKGPGSGGDLASHINKCRSAWLLLQYAIFVNSFRDLTSVYESEFEGSLGSSSLSVLLPTLRNMITDLEERHDHCGRIALPHVQLHDWASIDHSSCKMLVTLCSHSETVHSCIAEHERANDWIRRAVAFTRKLRLQDLCASNSPLRRLNVTATQFAAARITEFKYSSLPELILATCKSCNNYVLWLRYTELLLLQMVNDCLNYHWFGRMRRTSATGLNRLDHTESNMDWTIDLVEAIINTRPATPDVTMLEWNARFRQLFCDLYSSVIYHCSRIFFAMTDIVCVVSPHLYDFGMKIILLLDALFEDAKNMKGPTEAGNRSEFIEKSMNLIVRTCMHRVIDFNRLRCGNAITRRGKVRSSVAAIIIMASKLLVTYEFVAVRSVPTISLHKLLRLIVHLIVPSKMLINKQLRTSIISLIIIIIETLETDSTKRAVLFSILEQEVEEYKLHLGQDLRKKLKCLNSYGAR